MATFLYATKDGSNPKGKPRVYFTCHPDDFDTFFETLRDAIFKTHDCAIYYTEDMEETIAEEELPTDLGQMNLFVVPVTHALLTQPCRAMDTDINYAKQTRIPILPFMMESDLDKLYADPDKFGERQYLVPNSTDLTEIRFEDKLRKYLESVLISDEMAQRVRAAFDAYIFLSYRKKDRRYANELMRLIHKNPECRDIAIWYDEFLTPGESFTDSIQKAMAESKLFTLLVTPNLLEEPEGKPNFVMEVEYPEARKAEKVILPAEMAPTDHSALAEKFKDLPACADPHEEFAFKERLLQSIEKIAISANDQDPEHNFLIGLAYLDGIDVEVDRLQGFQLIASAAEDGLPEAMEYLIKLYRNGDIVPKNTRLAMEWCEKLLAHYTKEYGEDHPDAIRALVTLGDIKLRTTGHKKEENTTIYQEVLAHYQKAWDLHVRKHGEINDTAYSIMRGIDRVYTKYDPNRVIETRAHLYQIRKGTHGETHNYTIIALANIGIAYSNIKDHHRAREIMLEALPLASRTLGKNHAITLQIIDQLAYDSICIGRLQYALDLLTWEYNEEEYTAKGDPDVVAALLDTIATVYEKCKRYEKALEYQEKAFWMRYDHIPKENQNISNFHSIVNSFNKYCQHTALLAFLQKLYDRQVDTLGEQHKNTINTLEKIAETHRKLQDPRAALQIYHKLYHLQYAAFSKGLSISKLDFLNISPTLKHLCELNNWLGENSKAQFFHDRKTIHDLGYIGTQFMMPIELRDFYQRCGDWDSAMRMAEESYINKKREYTNAGSNETDERLLSLQKGLAEAYLYRENHGKALEYLSKIVDLQKQYLEADHPHLLKNLKVFSSLCRKLEMVNKAEEVENYVRKYENHLPDALPNSIDELRQLLLAGNILRSNEQTLALREKLYQLVCQDSGELSSSALEQLYHLAHDYERCGNHLRAAELLKKLHTLATTVLGDMYVVSADCQEIKVLEAIARCYTHSGNADKAIEPREALYTYYCKTHGQEDVHTQAALHQLATAYQAVGNLQKASELWEQKYAIALANYNAKSLHSDPFDSSAFPDFSSNNTKVTNPFLDDTEYEMIGVLGDLIKIYLKLRNTERAIELCKKLYNIHFKAHGKEHDDTLTTMGWLSYAYSDAGNSEKALEIQKEVYDLRVKVSGQDSPKTLTALNNLATIYAEVGDHQTALTLSKKVYNLRRKVSGQTHPQTLKMLRNLVYAHTWVSDPQTTLPVAQEAYDLHYQVHGATHPDTVELQKTLQNLQRKIEENT